LLLFNFKLFKASYSFFGASYLIHSSCDIYYELFYLFLNIYL